MSLLQINTLASEFDVAIDTQDADEIQLILQRFDKLSHDIAEHDVEPTEKQQQLQLCLDLHDKMEIALERAKTDIQKQLADAKRNGKKINKYLNV